MKFFKQLVTTIIIALVLINCSTENNNNPVNTQKVTTEDAPFGAIAKTSICPERDKYEIVVIDSDKWEILLNTSRVRNNCTSYTGHLWYQMGSYSFKGKAAAVFDPVQDLLCVTALDSGWNQGHILYALTFKENTNDLSGPYVYYESPQRTSIIDAWLVQGTIGSHSVTPSTLSKSVFYTPPTEHPKKKHFEMEINE